MESSVKERIIKFLAYLKIGQNKFEKQIGLSNGYINNVKSIGSDKLNKILKEYPQLNLEWLITGEGEMLNADKSKKNTPIMVDNETKEALNLLRKQLEQKDKQIESLLNLLNK
ncbi:hypothetical protein [Capnocytophaga catalasegens]|uniref:Transcriptional regulator n=1 Tax=Capnocytophaga catalasegens TaxID=1004260 RepID=A0AAV5ARF1_9FLAO|nr:hypothetical protein [Capnocytophaga catalasegens]GIZ15544.1 transcriptional regulator [Capnocytophaga catalasegens]GJM49887.1 transcriptional regulator [Capnocytophaga catalasegens]GJM54059.1 transcriptional regulator [Capnocytophaga catalasegens]